MSSHLPLSLTPRKTSQLNATVLPDGRWLLYNQAERSAITLTATAGILWELCDGKTSVGDIIRQLQEFYPDIPGERLESETWHMLSSFLEQGLVADHPAHHP